MRERAWYGAGSISSLRAHDQSSPPWVRLTPLGAAVEPEVNMTTATLSNDKLGGGGGGVRIAAAWTDAPPSIGSSTSSLPMARRSGALSQSSERLPAALATALASSSKQALERLTPIQIHRYAAQGHHSVCIDEILDGRTRQEADAARLSDARNMQRGGGSIDSTIELVEGQSYCHPVVRSPSLQERLRPETAGSTHRKSLSCSRHGRADTAILHPFNQAKCSASNSIGRRSVGPIDSPHTLSNTCQLELNSTNKAGLLIDERAITTEWVEGLRQVCRERWRRLSVQ
eukprot:6211811-Pleurochrysis_carterae.AAC.1